ncbi:C25 family cysteine peptidase [Cellulomonas edaphi]|uniref:C25 family cysteine peptidase n=1 Tax=Cellulomonas edaphi TaxID=3053468 RepID=A0ABT7S4S0_9CELL|nr:C25 family cysteine peptidase [Cellulomons edaphi]MDM7830622.1 C25 family cysteine peptidase [Cellulomons edaphi]
MGALRAGRPGVVNVVLVAPSAARALLAPLTACWSVTYASPSAPIDQVVRGADAVLVAGSHHRAPRTVLPGPVVLDDGRPVPVAWLPLVSDEATARFARAAASVHARASRRRTVAVLGQRLSRYDDLAGRIARVASAHGPVRRWTSYDVVRDDLVAGLRRGPALAVYVGHGRSIGWVGYAGLRAHHFPAAPGAPVGAVLSLACRTASRQRTGLSFTEALVVRGVAASAVGATGPTLHTANARWALRVADGAARAATVGELVAAAAAADPHADFYRIVGDPTAPLLDDPAFDPDPELDPELEVP